MRGETVLVTSYALPHILLVGLKNEAGKESKCVPEEVNFEHVVTEVFMEMTPGQRPQ